MRQYEYRHRVCLEETNVVGNVYYAHYVRWQGRCREMFMRDYAPQVMREFAQGLTLATTRVACTYYQELSAFDDVLIRMSAGPMTPSRLTMVFRYFRLLPGGHEELVADGEQEVACVRREGARVEPAALPSALRDAVARYIEPSPEPPAASFVESHR